MTPTMSEYFDAWKNSRFVAGAGAQEKAFVAASRLQDIADILGGLRTVYAGVRPRIAEADAAQAEQTGQDLDELTAFAERLRDEEAGGRKFTADQAETLGAEAQTRAEAIAGQISQAAGGLDIPLET
jgi:ketosteroid isomerase-like protein